MDTLFYFSIGTSVASLLTAGGLKLYAIAYARGYECGYADSERCGLCGFREMREPRKPKRAFVLS